MSPVDNAVQAVARPDFFIIGAPRSGTTALSEYLRANPHICFAEPKETQFFCTDMPEIRLCDTEAEYMELFFSHCLDRHVQATGEGSVWHLYSRTAIENILNYAPAARFIVMIRNPVDMVIALYEKLFELLWEDQSTFEKAWRMQDQRRAGRGVPKRCANPKLLLYRDIGLLGEQLAHFYAAVPQQQRLTIVFDDFASSPDEVYSRVLDFLGVTHDGRVEFPRLNEGRHVRSRWLMDFASHPPAWLVSVVSGMKRILGIRRLGVTPAMRRALLVPRKEKPVVTETFRKELAECFAGDIDKLSRLIGRDLSHWK